ncbi:hypothetical protein AB0K43_13275 [Kitasatospora sp. NPDC049258]|uniref:hypothetical protein n=1 Tax=Kitasatospora sp. NPDC049258 TaxID=3155394 RepID=UPI0034355227
MRHDPFPFPMPRLLPAAPDLRLLREVRDGHPAAFRPLMDRHWQSVRAYLGTCVADDAVADRLTEQTFAEQYRLARHDPPGQPVWRVHLFTTARTSAVRLLREPRGAAVLTDGFRQWATTGGAWPLDGHARLTEACRLLPGQWQTALWHAVVEQEETDHLARIVGLRRKDTRRLVARALAGLRTGYTELHRRAVEPHPACAATAHVLAEHTGPGSLPRVAVSHLARCGFCRDAEADLADLRGRLRGQLPAMLLGWWDGHGHRRRANLPRPTAPPAFLLRDMGSRRATDGSSAAQLLRTGLAVGSAAVLVSAAAYGLGGPSSGSAGRASGTVGAPVPDHAAAGRPGDGAAPAAAATRVALTPATEPIRAADYTAEHATEAAEADTRALGAVGWLRFDNVDFGAASKTRATVRFDARGTAAPKVLLRLDDPGSAPVAEAGPGGQEVGLRPTSGVHTVYLSARCPGAGLCLEAGTFSFR